MRSTAISLLLLLLLAPGAAARQARGDAPRLDPRIPKADRARHAEEWKTRWRNPRVLVTRAGTYLLLGEEALGDGARPVADLARALAALPRKAWPHGRIVALTTVGLDAVGPRSAGPRSAGPRSAGPRSAGPRSAGPLDEARDTLEALGVEAIESPVGCGC